MDLEDTEEFDQLATLASGYANTTRIALLIGFYQGYTATDVTNFLGVSRPGAQKSIERMIDADLIYRPAADDAPTYALTPLGEFFAQFFDVYGPKLLTAIAKLQETEADIRQQLQDSPMADGLNQADTDKLVHTKKWQQMDDQIRERLGLPDEPVLWEADSSPLLGFALDDRASVEELEKLLEETERIEKLLEVAEEIEE